VILGIDPGTRKCGFAVVDVPDAPPVELGIATLSDFPARLRELIAAHPIATAAIGRGTNAAVVAEIVEAAGVPYVLVDEYETSLLARGRFFRDHPPRGWRRFVPRGMLIPDRPIDDYAALLIAERYVRLAAAQA
jgi:RNase H-fold protein (predicted Holliday junction resolvase)